MTPHISSKKEEIAKDVSDENTEAEEIVPAEEEILPVEEEIVEETKTEDEAPTVTE